FDLIAFSLAGFCHLLRIDDQLRALERIREHLAEGALLALDMPFLEPVKWEPGRRPMARQWRRKNSSGQWVVKYARADPDLARQVQRLAYEFHREPEQDPA